MSFSHENRALNSTEEESGSFLCALEDVKNEILQVMEAKSETINDITEDLTQELTGIRDTVQSLKQQLEAVIPSLSTRSLGDENLSDSRSGRSRTKGAKRKATDPPPAQNIPYFDDLMRHEITVYLRKWSTATILLSFSNAFSQFDDGLPLALRSELRDSLSVMDGGSGLATLFFSVEVYHEWYRYHSKPGKLWSFVIRRTLSSMILDFRRKFFDQPSTPEDQKIGRAEPSWLTSFGGKEKISVVVSEIVQLLETTEKMARESQDPELMKRRKRIRDGKWDGGDIFERARFYAIFKLRGYVTRYWCYGRTEARKQLLKEVMFVVEKIRKSYGTNALAKEAGFWIEFQEPQSEHELNIPLDPAKTIWDIPNTYTGGKTNDELDALNSALLKNLMNVFPSLKLKVHFRRTVINLDPSIDPNSYPVFFDDSKEVYLHNVALTVFAESLRIADTSSVLRESNVSLKAIHVLACGIRGFILQSLCRDGTGAHAQGSVERIAMGLMTYTEAGKMDFEAASTIGNPALVSQGNPTTGSMRSIREEMSTINLAAYKEKIRKLDEEAAITARSVASGQENTVDAPDEIGHADLTEDFLSF